MSKFLFTIALRVIIDADNGLHDNPFSSLDIKTDSRYRLNTKYYIETVILCIHLV